VPKGRCEFLTRVRPMFVSDLLRREGAVCISSTLAMDCTK
jgi:hypothetical protein